tara:strand:- start:1419 stop:1835 length:417 start_codon:yes stop_codon:yes gene_type:complete
MKNIIYTLSLLISALVFTSCEKDEEHDHDSDNHSDKVCCTDGVCCSNDGTNMRIAMQDEGYIELEVNPIEKIDCYFEDWNKTILIPVSGLFEYYNQNDVWVATIDFGDGTCDEWVVKTWDTELFPENPEGLLEFSLFE